MAKRIVLKFGTGVLSRDGGSALDAAQIRGIAREVAALQRNGMQCVIVSSAAVAAGVARLGLSARPTELAAKQACAAIGQPELMQLYANAFAEHGLTVAQLLLTHDDLDSRTRHKNACNTLNHLLGCGVVPIINENDSVATQEMQFGDNDQLAAQVAQLIDADCLLLLTRTDGLTDASGQRIPVVKNLDEAYALVRPEKGEFSVGGMKSKLDAVGKALASGIHVAILDGRTLEQIPLAVHGKDVGTRFVP